MKALIAEIVALVATVGVIAAAWMLPLRLEAHRRADRERAVERVVTLTAVKDLGIWTEDRVVATNYWRRDLRPARPVLGVGRPVLLRLQSADAVHTFYSPELEIGPLEVYPGRVTEAIFTPRETGTFEYYCTTVCGDPHFAMKGEFTVGKTSSETLPEPASDEPQYWRLEPPAPEASRVERGHWLFEQKGCATCHGEAGRAGIGNHNAMNPEVLSLSPLASTLFLFSPEDVQAFVRAIEEGRDLEDLVDRAPVPLYGAVLTQYRGIRDVIRNGRKTVRMDPAGPVPPLDMPAWRLHLSDSDIDAIFAYLLTANLATDPLTSRDSDTGLELSSKGRQ